MMRRRSRIEISAAAVDVKNSIFGMNLASREPYCVRKFVVWIKDVSWAVVKTHLHEVANCVGLDMF